MKKIIYIYVALSVFVYVACTKQQTCDIDHLENCSDYITVYDTTYISNKYDCVKDKIAISHEFTIYETDKTSLEFGQPVATVSYNEVTMQGINGCTLPFYPNDCLGAENLKVTNLCNHRIKIALIMGQENFNIWADPFEVTSGGSETNGYCGGLKQLFILSVEKH